MAPKQAPLPDAYTPKGWEKFSVRVLKATFGIAMPPGKTDETADHPWEKGFTGDPRFAQAYRQWFAVSPWPDFAAPAGPRPATATVNAAFRAHLLDYLQGRSFIDTREA